MLRDSQNNEDKLWYKDGVIYQVHIKAYRDSNNDGLGDIIGLTEKLDYIKSLGITIIWLLPFYPSPQRDDGYDIADYLNINPDYGTIEDFKNFIRQAHKRKIKIVTELVLNHTSDQHEWFKRARKSPPGSPERDFYVWSNTPDKYKETRIIFRDFESSNWAWDPVAKAYYWHRFYSHQPDLNFENPQVHKSLLKVVDFWLDLGVDGLRLDAVPYLYEQEGTNCENLLPTHRFLKKIRSYIDNKYKGIMLLAEANQWPEDAVSYFGEGDECHMAFHFPLMPRIYMAVQMEIRFPIIDILEQTPSIPENCQWATFLRNHDELTLEMVTDEERDYMYRYFARDSKATINLGIKRRLAPLMENNRRKIELINILLFSLPGTPIIYYGDEIGMGDNYYLGDRNGVRTPMQWSPDRNAGFSDTNPQRLFLPVIIDPEYHYETVNVEVQERFASSLFWWMKKAIALRGKYKSFGRGSLTFLNPGNPKVLAFIRTYQEETILIVTNLSKYSQAVELDLKEYAGYIPMEIFSRNKFPQIKESWYVLTLSPHDYYWFSLEKQKVLHQRRELVVPEYETKKSWKKFIQEDINAQMDDGLMTDYLEFHGRIDTQLHGFRSVELIDTFFLDDDYRCSIMLLRVNYADKQSEILLQPIKITPEQDAGIVIHSRNSEVIAKLKTEKENLFIYNGIYDDEFRKEMFRAFFRKRSIKGLNGELNISLSKNFRSMVLNIPDPASFILKDYPEGYSLQFSDKLFLKLYRKPEEGIQPGEEMLHFFETTPGFSNVPSLDGVVKYTEHWKKPLTIGIVNEYIPNQGTAWHYFGDALGRYFDKVLSSERDKTESKSFMTGFFISDEEKQSENSLCGYSDPIAISSAGLMGVRTGEMHITLYSEKEKKDFAPEPFSALYQRSVYQSIRTSIKNTFRNLRHRDELKTLDELNPVISGEDILLNFAEQMINKKLDADKLRIHGDYHLGQVMFTGKDFVITNFEGVYSYPVSERRLKRSPLRDVASMLWSFYFAASQGLSKYHNMGISTEKELEFYSQQWWFCMSTSFLSSYFKTIKEAEFVPAEKETIDYLIMFYLLEKTVSELNNILFQSPEMLHIPLDLINYIIRRIEKKDDMVAGVNPRL